MYIPVMKNRTVEVSVLQQLGYQNVFVDQIVPLVELIQEKTRSNSKLTFIQELARLLDSCQDMSVMVDFYKSTKLRNTTDAIREYVTMSVRYPEHCLSSLNELAAYGNRVIPVISYLTEDISIKRIKYEAESLRAAFSRLAFRVKIQEFERVFPEIVILTKPNDYLILDIESASHMNPVFKKVYKRIADSKKQYRFLSIIVNSHRPESLANKDMVDAEPIAQIDNSLKELYATTYMNRFDGFGDYACISSALPSTGGTISPVGIYYSRENNYFVAYRGRAPQLSEFPEFIAPRISQSEYWREFSDAHHHNCPGCREIRGIVDGVKSGRNQAQWKMITMLHYIYSISEEMG